jgi:predicted small secreted protein
MKKTKLVLICLSLVAAGLLSACNTIRGVGQDVQRAGSAIENSMKK